MEQVNMILKEAQLLDTMNKLWETKKRNLNEDIKRCNAGCFSPDANGIWIRKQLYKIGHPKKYRRRKAIWHGFWTDLTKRQTLAPPKIEISAKKKEQENNEKQSRNKVEKVRSYC